MAPRPPLLAALLLMACPSSSEPGAPSENAPEAKAHEPVDADALDLPSVDAKEAKQLQEALPTVDPEMRGVLAAEGLAELEKGRLPDSFREGLDANAKAPPEQRSLLLARALAASLPMLDHLCEDGRALMGSIAKVANEQRGLIIFDRCDLKSHGLVTRDDMEVRDPMAVLVGHLVLDHLSRGGELHPGERAAVEALVETPLTME